ncbi:microtubule-associated serine/threonine-protein kinase 2-like [Amphiprion ocellaris]|uniref:microtubule-associated serine/threonine-protein kinase 2-like n=1 Tax=Amphiprion ocellaris TaxID=80972 RepID=UPI00241173DD|nr:microtubule-associated serine/threonine-protein kinase 2-like [Amphiprion ocellaris]
MNKCPTAVNSPAHPVCVSGSDAVQMSKTGPNANNVSLRAKNKDRQGPHHIQEPRQRPLSTISISDVTPYSHQRRWSADFCTCGNSTGIIVRKKKKQPKPPQRCLALLQPHSDSQASVRRYSCPPLGTSTSPGQSSSSSSSSSTTSSCSSPPPTQTSVVAGHDPRGWRLHRKSSSTSSPLRANRLSLQISIPVTPVPNTPNNPEPSTKPALRPKPFHRHHSDSSASLRFLGSPRSGVTAEELCAVRLRHVTLSDDDVFTKGAQEKDKVTTRPRKIPPPVPEKTALARQIAQLISHSRRRCGQVTAKSDKNESLHTGVMTPNPEYSHQTVENSSICARVNNSWATSSYQQR